MKTNYSNVTFQIGFNAEIISGSLEFNKAQVRFFVSGKNNDITSSDEIGMKNAFTQKKTLNSLVI